LGATTFALAPDGRQILAVKEKTTSHLWSFPLSLPAVTELESGIQLTSGDVRDQRGRWSADGSSIFFESVRRGSLDIWRVNVTGDNLVRLTTAAGSELRPRPSPRIAPDMVDARGEFTHLMRPDGSDCTRRRALVQEYTHVCCAGWSPTAHGSPSPSRRATRLPDRRLPSCPSTNQPEPQRGAC
jgi:Tol biopolymer transport system component